MSKSLSLATVLEKNKLSSDVPFIALLDIEVINPATGVVVIVLHVANNPSSITYNGTLYEAGGFDFQVNSEAGKAPEVSLTVNDYTQAVQGYMQSYGGGLGSNVTLTIARGDALTLAPEMQEFFQITGASAANYSATFQLGAENSVMKTFPRRRQYRDFCQWRYKDSTTCKYTGGLSTCDLTLQGPNGCAAHGNTPNFGAYPGLSSNGARYY